MRSIDPSGFSTFIVMSPQDLYTLPNSESPEIAIILESKEISLISDTAILTFNSQFENIINGEGIRCKMEKKVLWDVK